MQKTFARKKNGQDLVLLRTHSDEIASLLLCPKKCQRNFPEKCLEKLQKNCAFLMQQVRKVMLKHFHMQGLQNGTRQIFESEHFFIDRVHVL